MIAQRGCPRNAGSSPRAVVVCLARTQGRSCCTMTTTQSAGVGPKYPRKRPTLGPFGPSLTAQTADPCTKQCEHLHVVLSLQNTCQRKTYLTREFGETCHSLRLPAPPPPYPALPTSGVDLPTGLKLLNRLFFLLRSPLPIAGVSSPSP